MSNNKKKLIAIYKKALKEKRLPTNGLCATLKEIGLGKDELNSNFSLFVPTYEEETEFIKQGLSYAYWGSGADMDSMDKYDTFTPLRQTILAFLIAMEK